MDTLLNSNLLTTNKATEKKRLFLHSIFDLFRNQLEMASQQNTLIAVNLGIELSKNSAFRKYENDPFEILHHYRR